MFFAAPTFDQTRASTKFLPSDQKSFSSHTFLSFSVVVSLPLPRIMYLRIRSVPLCFAYGMVWYTIWSSERGRLMAAFVGRVCDHVTCPPPPPPPKPPTHVSLSLYYRSRLPLSSLLLNLTRNCSTTCLSVDSADLLIFCAVCRVLVYNTTFSSSSAFAPT